MEAEEREAKKKKRKTPSYTSSNQQRVVIFCRYTCVDHRYDKYKYYYGKSGYSICCYCFTIIKSIVAVNAQTANGFVAVYDQS